VFPTDISLSVSQSQHGWNCWVLKLYLYLKPLIEPFLRICSWPLRNPQSKRLAGHYYLIQPIQLEAFDNVDLKAEYFCVVQLYQHAKARKMKKWGVCIQIW
jgi:hypothetical protein